MHDGVTIHFMPLKGSRQISPFVERYKLKAFVKHVGVCTLLVSPILRAFLDKNTTVIRPSVPEEFALFSSEKNP